MTLVIEIFFHIWLGKKNLEKNSNIKISRTYLYFLRSGMEKKSWKTNSGIKRNITCVPSFFPALTGGKKTGIQLEALSNRISILVFFPHWHGERKTGWRRENYVPSPLSYYQRGSRWWQKRGGGGRERKRKRRITGNWGELIKKLGLRHHVVWKLSGLSESRQACV